MCTRTSSLEHGLEAILIKVFIDNFPVMPAIEKLFEEANSSLFRQRHHKFLPPLFCECASLLFWLFS